MYFTETLDFNMIKVLEEEILEVKRHENQENLK